MSLIGLLASTEKMVPEGRLHMRPFPFHLKEHWRYPQSLDNLLPWTDTISAHLDWWQNPANVMKGSDLHPKDHSIQLFTDASNEGWGAHLDQRVQQDLPGSRGMGIVDRPIGHLPSHSHPPKLKEIPGFKVLPQVTGVPVHLPSFRTSHSPPGLYNDRKGSEAHGPLQRTQTSPIPGRLADQVPVYKSKWALFEKWCRKNSVDFSTPSVKQISDFFMYLYQDLNRCPSTIDGYRTAIVDTLGPMAHHIAHNPDLHRLLSSFHRDRPKSSRNLPKWNLSVVLNELTKAPFEPMKDTDLKHLTLKTAFLLALASGKRRSEIHAWVAKNKISNLGQWEKVALFPSSDFIAKNQLARTN